MRRVPVGRVEPARGRRTAQRDVEAAAAFQRRVVTHRRLCVGVRSERCVTVDPGRPGARSCGHVEDGAEAQAVLRGIRSLDEVDEGKVVDVDLAADIAVQFLRQRHAVDHVVDDAVIAIDVNHAVGALHGPRHLGFHSREAVVEGKTSQGRAVEHDVAAAAVDRERLRLSDDGVFDLAQLEEGDADRGSAASQVDSDEPTQVGLARLDVVAAQRERRKRKVALRVAGRLDGEIVSGRGDRDAARRPAAARHGPAQEGARINRICRPRCQKAQCEKKGRMHGCSCHAIDNSVSLSKRSRVMAANKVRR